MFAFAMVFFDLNIPYVQRDGAAATTSQEASAAASRAGRLKVVVKAMELGYTGVAYNRAVRGIVADADRCKIRPFPLSSLLKVAPAIDAAARFHRELLGVPLSSPFRQYTRLTVALDSALGAAALNPGNAVLLTYHLVAVRPLNQTAFDQACKVSEVDLISIDFSQKLPFRLKLPMVKAAIERGVFFEITYSHLISDIDTRRQMISNGKMLVDWTRGKNLILSSGTSSVNELRGPYDVANLSTLLGLSMERAKVAISRNCRSLLTSALRRKQCYKEAIRVEKISPSPHLDTKKAWFVDWSNWDPISSGEGDLPALDDIAKFFSDSGRASKSHSEINFETVSDQLPSDKISFTRDLMSLDDRGPPFPVTNECETSAATDERPQQNSLEAFAEDEIPLSESPVEHQLPENQGDPGPSEEHQLPDNEGDVAQPGDIELFSSDKESELALTENEDPGLLNKSDVLSAAAEEPTFDNLSKSPNSANEFELMSLDDSLKLFPDDENVVPSSVCVSEFKSSVVPESVSGVLDTPADGTSLKGLISGIESELPLKDDERPLCSLMEIDSSFTTKDAGNLSETYSALDVPEVEVLASVDKLEKKDPFMSVYDLLFLKDVSKCGMSREDDRVPFLDVVRFNQASDAEVQHQRDTVTVDDGMPSEETLVKMEKDGEASAAAAAGGSQRQKLKPGKVRFKRKSTCRGLPFLSKHFLHHIPSKKKIQHSNGSTRKSCKSTT